MISYIRSFFDREGMGQMAKLVLIGFVNTAVDFAVFNALPRSLAVDWRVTIAFAVATEVSYLLNRHWTFRLRGGKDMWRETAVFFLVNAVAWAATYGVVKGAEVLWGQPGLSRLGENLAKLVAGFVILLPKLASYRDIVFRRSLARRAAASAEDGAPPQAGGIASHLPESPGSHPAD